MRKRVAWVLGIAMLVAGCGSLGGLSVHAVNQEQASRPHLRLRAAHVLVAPATEATVSQLVSGRWSALPRAPIAPHYDATFVWTGRELIVWGGVAYLTQKPLATGAAYNPASGRWHRLPIAPLGGRDGNAAMWTGREMFVWGGYTPEPAHTFRVSADGALYSPSSSTWRMLPPAPLSARAFPLAVWTGRRVLLLGGRPAVSTDALRSYPDGATYDPAAKRWAHISPPTPPQGHGIDWIAAVQAGTQLLAWSDWTITRKTGASAFSETGGVDLFDYNELTGRWRRLPTEPNELPAVDTALWTGHDVLVRGITYNCGSCWGRWVPEATDLFNPAGNSWSRLPPDPLASNDPLSTWTGAALVSFNAGGIFGPTVPGDTSAYDPRTRRWSRLPRAPFACNTSQPPIWTGRQLLMYCPRAGKGNAGQHDGLAFTIDKHG